MPYCRAVLGENSIVIKEQSGSRHSQGYSEIHDNNSLNSSFLETTSLISCITCLSDNTDFRADREASNPNVIPYSKILNARAVNDAGNCAPGSLNPFHDEQSLDEEDTPDDLKMSSVMVTSPYFQSGSLVEVTFAKPRRNDLVPKTVTLLIEPCSRSTASMEEEVDVVEEILRRSYKNAKRGRSIFLLINPYGGKGKAKKLYLTKLRPILVASGCAIEVKETTHANHARSIAEELDIVKYDVIACASGDGIPHEVLNGLYRRNDRAKAFNKLAITQLPCGSGNAMSISCYGTSNPSYAALSLVKAAEVRMDVMCCMQPSYAESPRLSFLSQTYGIIAESDINTEFMRWLGSARFELGVTLNLLQRKRYPCDLYVKYVAKSKNELREHYLNHKEKVLQGEYTSIDIASSLPSLDSSSTSHTSTAHLTEDTCFELDDSSFKTKWSLHEPVPSDWERVDVPLGDNLGIFYVGKMPYMADDAKLFPAALPDDGVMDMVLTDGRTPLLRMVPILLSLDKGSHVLQPEVEHSKILAYRLVPKMKNSIISVDGERFPFEPIQVEVLPRLVKILLKDGSYVDTEFNNL